MRPGPWQWRKFPAVDSDGYWWGLFDAAGELMLEMSDDTSELSRSEMNAIAIASLTAEKLREVRRLIPDPGSISRPHDKWDAGAEIDELLALLDKEIPDAAG